MTTTSQTRAQSQRIYELIASRKGTTITQIALLAAIPHHSARSSVGYLRTRGLIRAAGYVTKGRKGGKGSTAGLWVAIDGASDYESGPLIREKHYTEDDATAARWAELMAGRRYEDTERSRPVIAPRRYSAEPMSGIGCAAAMCAGIG